MWVLACVANGIVIKRQQSLAEELLSLAENGEETLSTLWNPTCPKTMVFSKVGLCTNKRESLNYKAMELFSDNVASLCSFSTINIETSFSSKHTMSCENAWNFTFRLHAHFILQLYLSVFFVLQASSENPCSPCMQQNKFYFLWLHTYL